MLFTVVKRSFDCDIARPSTPRSGSTTCSSSYDMSCNFKVRDKCPACHTRAVNELCASSLTSPPLSEYLEVFYAPQGGIELAELEGGEYVLLECISCGLVFQRNVLSDELMNRLYEKWIDPVRSLAIYEAETGLSHVLAQVRQIADLVSFVKWQQPSQIKALDYGMGWGHWCQLAMAFGMTVYGHELSPSKIESAARKGIKNLSSEELNSHTFDFINADQVFEHLSDPLETLKSLVHSLKPEGFIRIGVPDGWNIQKRLKSANWTAAKQARNSLNPVAPLEHINCFNHHALVSMARIAGLEPVSVPTRYAMSCLGNVKSILRPFFYILRGMPGTSQYFRRLA